MAADGRPEWTGKSLGRGWSRARVLTAWAAGCILALLIEHFFNVPGEPVLGIVGVVLLFGLLIGVFAMTVNADNSRLGGSDK